MQNKDQWEEDAKDHFVAALAAQGRGDWFVSNTDVVVDPQTNINFDYQLQHENQHIALEIFRLVETQEEIKRSKAWTQITNAIVAELRKRGVKGFTIEAPYSFNIPPNKAEQFASKIAHKLEDAIRNNPNVDPIQESGFEIKRIDDFPDVTMFGIGPGGAVNPSGDAFVFMERKLPKKNRQLNIQNHERVIVIVNWLPLVDQENMIQACGQIDFSQFTNIDKVFFDDPNRGTVHLVYDRKVYDALQPEGEPPPEIEPLFLSWLANSLNAKNLQALRLVQRITEREKSLLWLPAHSREELTGFGEEFLRKDEPKDLYWIIEHLRQDPDPPIENAPNDPDGKYNKHLRVQRGERIGFIHSVQARLCWLLMQLITKPRTEDYEMVFEIIERFVMGANLYVRCFATFPLMELARRRYAKTKAGERLMSDSLAMRIKTLALRMVEENQNYPVVLESVANVMLFVLDLDEATAQQTVETLLTIEDSEAANDVSSIIIYFSLFRENEFAYLGAFNSKRLRELFSDRLQTGSGRFRASAMDHFKCLLGLKRIQFEALIPYLEALLSGRPDRIVNHHFHSIATRHASTNPEVIANLLVQATLNELQTSAKEGKEVWYPKEFTDALRALSDVGPDYKDRVAGLMREMETYKARIAYMYDF